jgi:hypothetical protein
MKEPLILLFLSSLLLFPIVASRHKEVSLFLYSAIVVLILIFYWKEDGARESYDRMDFFPWNEANLVRKRHPNSTVIDCAWSLDQKKSDNIFQMSDPVVAPYSNLPEQ